MCLPSLAACLLFAATAFAQPAKTVRIDRRFFSGLETVPGREVYNRVDAWAQDETGDLYGGTLRVRNLGKPLNQYRIRGLAFARSRLYGIGGDNNEMARLFSYDPVSGVYEMLGMIDVNRRPYLGQAERRAKLYLFYPN